MLVLEKSTLMSAFDEVKMLVLEKWTLTSAFDGHETSLTLPNNFIPIFFLS